jgi:ribosomal protein S18 acetylase RimI-like enzyme
MDAKVQGGHKRKAIEMRLGDLTKDNIGQLKLITEATLPVRYQDKHYATIQKEPNKELMKLAFHCDNVVGAVCCRLEETKAEPDEKDKQKSANAEKDSAEKPETEQPKQANPPKKKQKKGDKRDKEHKEEVAALPPIRKVYIMTLGVLAAYRNRGIGTKLLQHIIEFVEKRSDISEIYLHVQTNNDDAMALYKRHGFDVVATVENYYTRIQPPNAYRLSRKQFNRVAPSPVVDQKDKGDKTAEKTSNSASNSASDKDAGKQKDNADSKDSANSANSTATANASEKPASTTATNGEQPKAGKKSKKK